MTPGRDEKLAGPRMLTFLGCGMGLLIVAGAVVASLIVEWARS